MKLVSLRYLTQNVFSVSSFGKGKQRAVSEARIEDEKNAIFSCDRKMWFYNAELSELY